MAPPRRIASCTMAQLRSTALSVSSLATPNLSLEPTRSGKAKALIPQLSPVLRGGSLSKLVFASTDALERALDGSDETYFRYFFALYHCSPDEPAGLNDLRRELRDQFPTCATPVGRHFVLYGEAAFRALHGYYDSMSKAETLPDDFRAYAAERRDEISVAHRKSLSLSIELSEGQLSRDERLAFYALVALSNGQIFEHGKG